MISTGGDEPQYFRGIAMDISAGGLRVKSYQLGPEQCEQIRSRPYHCDVHLDLPYLKEPLKLRAAVAWVGYQDATRSDSAHAMLGLRLEDVRPEAMSSLQYVIHRLSGESVSVKSGQHNKLPRL